MLLENFKNVHVEVVVFISPETFYILFFFLFTETCQFLYFISVYRAHRIKTKKAVISFVNIKIEGNIYINMRI